MTSPELLELPEPVPDPLERAVQRYFPVVPISAHVSSFEQQAKSQKFTSPSLQLPFLPLSVPSPRPLSLPDPLELPEPVPDPLELPELVPDPLELPEPVPDPLEFPELVPDPL